MNKNKIVLDSTEILTIRVTITDENRTFYISDIKPFNIENDIVIEEIDSDKNIIGMIKLPRNLLLSLTAHFITEVDSISKYKTIHS